MMPEGRNMTKTLLGTELGHNFSLIGLVGSKYRLSGLSYVTIHWLLPTAKTFTRTALRLKISY